MATHHPLFLAGPCHRALGGLLGLVSPDLISISLCEAIVVSSSNSSTSLLQPLWRNCRVGVYILSTWQMEIGHGWYCYCWEWFVVTFVSVGFCLLSLTRSSKIHFKLILKAKSETNCIVTGEKCQCRNAVRAVAHQWINLLGQKAMQMCELCSLPLQAWALLLRC